MARDADRDEDFLECNPRGRSDDCMMATGRDSKRASNYRFWSNQTYYSREGYFHQARTDDDDGDGGQR